ncbi:hypothetical protein BGZ95_002917 [Linnemannia exigua]|uniref:Uncharacterized protein n=1 Tax=Linnemannia exigua TaxID=604196 RepID=A0AAD4DI70_9FUNG|nr:hypothetical protein BGZ95_002917 [Linnemannia exigua]
MEGQQDERPIDANNNADTQQVEDATDNSNIKAGGNSRTKTAAAATAAASAASRSRKSPSVTAVTSIAERLPKGSRAKPLPPKSTTPTTTPSIATSIYSENYQQQQTQTGDKLSQAISLSSSMPSIPSQMEPIDLDEDGDEHMTEKSAFYLTLASDDSKSQQQRQHVNIDKDQDKLVDRAAGTGIPHGVDPRMKQSSVVSIASSKDEFGSIIPSVQVERIANWMGGVKEAMEEEDTVEFDSVAQAINNNSSSSNTTTNTVKAETVEDTPAAITARKPALRRPPPAPARHAVTAVDASPPLPPLAQAESVEEVIPSSLAEDEPLQRNYRSGQRSTATNQGSESKGKRVFVEDSLSSLPPVPLFHESSNASESDAHRRRSGGAPSTSTTPKATVAGQGSRADDGPSSHCHNNPVAAAQDDLSTIVGGQAPTQDSFVRPMQSLPSFIYEEDEETHARNAHDETEHIQHDPSLPSELTASCLQELGLKRKNVRDRGYGPGKRHAKSRRGGYGLRGSNIDRVLEEGDNDGEDDDEDEEDEEEQGGVGGVALAQRVAFPSSLDLAPISTLSGSVTPPLSLEVIEGPRATYTPAGRTVVRANKEKEGPIASSSSAQQFQHMDPNLASLPSFPSPPASLVFSTLPSMPTLPTFPSILQQEPSLIMLDSQTQQTEQTQESEYTQPSPEVDY